MGKREPGSSEVKILFQNSRVRLGEMILDPGDKGRMVERPDRVRYVLAGGQVREHFPDGRYRDFELNPGTVQWEDKSTSSMENIGDSEIRFITVQVF